MNSQGAIKKKTLINLLSILLCLTPFLLLTGPFLPDLSISIMGSVFLFIALKERLWHYFNNNYSYFFLLFNTYLILRSIFSDHPYLSFESSLFYFRFYIFSLSVWFLLDNNLKLQQYFKYTLIVACIIVIIDCFFQYIFGTNIIGIENYSADRMTLTFNDKQSIGIYLVNFVPLLIGLVLMNSNLSKKNIILISLLLILMSIAIFLSGERTAIALLLFTSFLLFVGIKIKIRFKILIIFISMFFILSILYFDENIKNRNINYTFKQMNISSLSLNNMIFFSTAHEILFQTSWNIYKDNKVFGVGPKLFRVYCDDNRYKINDRSCSTHPHNIYIQLITETGLVGFSFLFFLLINVYLRFITNVNQLYLKIFNRNYNYKICLIISFMINLWPIIPSLNIFNNWINVIYFLPVGFYLQYIYCNKLTNHKTDL